MKKKRLFDIYINFFFFLSDMRREQIYYYDYYHHLSQTGCYYYPGDSTVRFFYLYKRNKLTFSFSTPSILMFDLTHVDRLSSIHQTCMCVLQNIPEQVDVGVCMYVYLKLVRDVLIF